MRNNSLALVTVIALCISGIGAGLAPLPAAATTPYHNPAALGAFPAWFATMPDDEYAPADPETTTDVGTVSPSEHDWRHPASVLCALRR